MSTPSIEKNDPGCNRGPVSREKLPSTLPRRQGGSSSIWTCDIRSLHLALAALSPDEFAEWIGCGCGGASRKEAA
jgi:hypothetical protein